MTGEYDRVQQAAGFVRGQLPDVPEVAIVLGSGLGDFAGGVADAVSMPYGSVPGWPPSTVVGHAGRLVVEPCGGGEWPCSPGAVTSTKATRWTSWCSVRG